LNARPEGLNIFKKYFICQFTLIFTELIKNLQDENKILVYMTQEKLKKEIDSKRKIVQDLQKFASIPAMDSTDLEEMRQKVASTVDVNLSLQCHKTLIVKINELNQEISQIVEQKNLNNNPVDDKLAIFKQQV